MRISRRAQIIGACCASTVLLGWGALTMGMIADSASVARDRAVLTEQGQAVASKAKAVNAYRQSVDELADDLEARQDFMEDIYRSHFGADADRGKDAVVGKDDGKSADPAAKKSTSLSVTISDAPGAAPLLRIEERQRRFAAVLTKAVQQRADKAAAAIRSFGLNPDALARNADRAQGGPFIPWKGDRDALTEDLKALAVALDRMELLERTLVAIPSGQPTAAPMLTSSYGYRRDPFNGHPAFHAGLDFPGRYGQPILSAARGRVSYVGQRQGYGNVVEVEHGNGLMTRYAHLSGFGARVGKSVARGDQIGRMGSTGRSTGTHLHFEVRLNGQAINPRRFLEARQDVLQIQQIAKARFADVGNRG